MNMESAALLSSFNEEQKEAIRHVVRESLERHNIQYKVFNRQESTIKKKVKDKGKTPSIPLHGGCCFNQSLTTIPHNERVEISPNCFAAVPRLLVNMVTFLDNHRDAEGIFRISGTNRRLKILRGTICEERILDDPSKPVNPHDVASLLKHFFRDIPGCLLTEDCVVDMMTAAEKFEGDDDKLTSILLDLCLVLPMLNLATLRYAATFFQRVAADCHKNKMPVDNLACVLTPNLMGPAGPGPVLTRQTKVISLLLANANLLGLVSHDRVVSSQNILPYQTPKAKNAGGHMLRPCKKRMSDAPGNERKPLGTINNFVSSLASRIANTRRSGVTTNRRSGACPTVGTSSLPMGSASTSDDPAGIRQGLELTEEYCGANRIPEDLVLSYGKRRCSEVSPPAKVHREGRFRSRYGTNHYKPMRKTPASATTSLPVISIGQRSEAPFGYNMPSYDILAAFPGEELALPTKDVQMDDSPPSTEQCMSSETSTGLGSRTHGVPDLRIFSSRPLMDRSSATRIARRYNPDVRIRAFSSNHSTDTSSTHSMLTRGRAYTAKSMSEPLHGIGETLRLSMDNTGGVLDINDVSIHLPSLSGGGTLCTDDMTMDCAALLP